MSEAYLKRILRKTWNDTLGFFGWNKKTLFFGGIYVLGLLIFSALSEWSDVWVEVKRIVSFGIVAPIAGAVVLFIYYLVTAPARLQAESDTQVEQLDGQLDRIQNKQDAVDELSDLLSEGIHTIWNAPVTDDAQLHALEAHWHDWHRRVLDHLTAHFNRADVDHFNRLGVLPITERDNTYLGGSGQDGTHRRILMHYALQEQRLREIVRDHNVTHI